MGVLRPLGYTPTIVFVWVLFGDNREIALGSALLIGRTFYFTRSQEKENLMEIYKSKETKKQEKEEKKEREKQSKNLRREFADKNIGIRLPVCDKTAFKNTLSKHNIAKLFVIRPSEKTKEQALSVFCEKMKKRRDFTKAFRTYASNPNNIAAVHGYLPVLEMGGRIDSYDYTYYETKSYNTGSATLYRNWKGDVKLEADTKQKTVAKDCHYENANIDIGERVAHSLEADNYQELFSLRQTQENILSDIPLNAQIFCSDSIFTGLKERAVNKVANAAASYKDRADKSSSAWRNVKYTWYYPSISLMPVWQFVLEHEGTTYTIYAPDDLSKIDLYGKNTSFSKTAKFLSSVQYGVFISVLLLLGLTLVPFSPFFSCLFKPSDLNLKPIIIIITAVSIVIGLSFGYLGFNKRTVRSGKNRWFWLVSFLCVLATIAMILVMALTPK